MSVFSSSIIKWYETYKRDLPWRDSTDAYQIWISEIILQQTRVVQGYHYFMRFMKRFPDVKTLADAPEDEVMKYWQGLGYYSRARNLHAAAQSIGAEFPKTYSEVRALKGVGDYTAAAICSFAYNMPYAVVDGNVYRVLARYLGIDTPIDSALGKRQFSYLADEMLDRMQPAIYNQAIMDFGALQCVPQSPSCFQCPLVETCAAYKNNLVATLPVKVGKTKVTNRYLNYFFVRQDEYTYLRKRTGKDIWQNLYELPLVESDSSLLYEEILTQTGFHQLFPASSIHSVQCVCSNVKHQLSHRTIYATFYEVVLSDIDVFLDGYTRIHLNEINDFPVAKLTHSFLEKYM